MTSFVHVLSSCQSLVFYYSSVGNFHSLFVVFFSSIFPLVVKCLLYGLCAPCHLFLQILFSHPMFLTADGLIDNVKCSYVPDTPCHLLNTQGWAL